MAGGGSSSKISKRERLASEDACHYPRSRASQHNRHVLCARIAVVVAMLTVTLLVSAVCVMAHHEQNRRMLLQDNRKRDFTADDEDRRSLLAILDLRKLVDRAGSVFTGPVSGSSGHEAVANEAEILRRWEEQNRKECTIVVTKKFRGRCSKSSEGLHLCISGKHMVENHEQCESPETN